MKGNTTLSVLQDWEIKMRTSHVLGQIPLKNQRGSLGIMATFSLVAILGMVALGIEVGRWYIVRAELSKTVDAAVLSGAKNFSNPYINPETFVQEVAIANFSPGFMGTEGTPTFTTTFEDPGKVYMTASVNAVNSVGKVLDSSQGASGTFDTTAVGSLSAAELRESEVMLVLDRSSSMSGSPWADLQEASVSFLEFFEDSQDQDKFGLIMFDAAAQVYQPLGTDFVTPMTVLINGTSTGEGTNAEDGLDQVDGPGGLTDQSGLPGDQRVQQFVVFFSDGHPTRFRGQFTREGQDYDAVLRSSSDKDQQLYDSVTGSSLDVKQFKTGDGLPSGSSACDKANTKWWILEDPVYGVNGTKGFPALSGMDPNQCDISRSTMEDYAEYLEEQMAIDHAAELKAKGILIFSVGLGDIDQDFLLSISSGEDYVYYTPDSSELQALFHKIASTIKLRLVS